jgi:hypothetical protein
VDVSTGKVTVSGFNPTEQLRGPDGATHFSLQVGFLRIDFASGAYELTQSVEEVYPIVTGIIAPTLTPETVPSLPGTGMHLILIEFFQEINGVQYMLNNGAFNVLHLLKLS